MTEGSSLILDSLTWKENAFQHPWDSVEVYTPFIRSHPTGSVKCHDLDKPLQDPDGSTMATEGMVFRPSDCTGGRIS